MLIDVLSEHDMSQLGASVLTPGPSGNGIHQVLNSRQPLTEWDLSLSRMYSTLLATVEVVRGHYAHHY